MFFRNPIQINFIAALKKKSGGDYGLRKTRNGNGDFAGKWCAYFVGRCRNNPGFYG
jgi:hypothetical protein